MIDTNWLRTVGETVVERIVYLKTKSGGLVPIGVNLSENYTKIYHI